MRAPLALALCLVTPYASAQPRAAEPGGNGTYSTVGARPRVAVTPSAPAAAPTTASVTTVSATTGVPPTPGAVTITTAGVSGPRGPGVETTATAQTITTGRAAPPTQARNAVVASDMTYVMGPNGTILAVPRVQLAPSADPDAGVDDPNVPTTGALYGGPLPGPSIAYMGIPVNTRRPPPAPPLAPGAVLPGHALPGSTAAPPPGATPWIPYTTSGFQLGPGGASTETGGYGFQMQSGQRGNPGTIRNSP